MSSNLGNERTASRLYRRMNKLFRGADHGRIPHSIEVFSWMTVDIITFVERFRVSADTKEFGAAPSNKDYLMSSTLFFAELADMLLE